MEAKRLFKNSPKKVYSQEAVTSDVLITQIYEVRAYGFKWVATPTVELCLLCHRCIFGQEMLLAVPTLSFYSPWRLCVPFIVFSPSRDIMCKLIILAHNRAARAQDLGEKWEAASIWGSVYTSSSTVFTIFQNLARYLLRELGNRLPETSLCSPIPQ